MEDGKGGLGIRDCASSLNLALHSHGLLPSLTLLQPYGVAGVSPTLQIRKLKLGELN